ncbi:MAG: hypothetical protein CBD69_002185 [Crocinitomicaceae bacterium TMED209]|nr:MAG: hypothetical protein CBD69_002185 [Crocinitomicaceae bacterium TMED209]
MIYTFRFSLKVTKPSRKKCTFHGHLHCAPARMKRRVTSTQRLCGMMVHAKMDQRTGARTSIVRGIA